jgi:lipopolysaccharide export system permease protein
MFRLILPLMLCVLAVTVGLMMLNEMILPSFKSQVDYIYRVTIQKRPPNVYYKNKFWHKGQNSIYNIGSYDPENKVLRNLTYYGMDQNFKLITRIDAQRAQYVDGIWRFYNGIYQKWEAPGYYKTSIFKTQEVALPELPQDFTRMAKPTSAMNMPELLEFINKIEAEGYNARSYLVDLYGKLSRPFICLIISFLAIPLVLLKGKGKESRIAQAIVIGAGLSLVYWVMSGYLTSTLGYRGLLPPLLVAWIPNIIYSLLGLWLFSHVNQ